MTETIPLTNDLIYYQLATGGIRHNTLPLFPGPWGPDPDHLHLHEKLCLCTNSTIDWPGLLQLVKEPQVKVICYQSDNHPLVYLLYWYLISAKDVNINQSDAQINLLITLKKTEIDLVNPFKAKQMVYRIFLNYSSKNLNDVCSVIKENQACIFIFINKD